MSMSDKIATLWPEIVTMIAAFLTMIIGLSPRPALRRSPFYISFLGLLIAGALVFFNDALGLPQLPPFVSFVKLAVCSVGILLLWAAAELPDQVDPVWASPGVAGFDPTATNRGEFFSFFLFSLIGVMLTAGADDLIWLFLALELTSLPTYVMVATMRNRIEAPEAGVKYFFLGAFSSAVFLYGFTLIYGATGSTYFNDISGVFDVEGVSLLALLGMALSVLGIAFKIAAFPMHFYAADVYQGAATPVTAFLAFVPKTAGFIALMLLLMLVGTPLENAAPPITGLLWLLAVVTMFVGNTLALRQDNVKRVLAYSSIAHSGYMLVGLVAGPGIAAMDTPFVRNGYAAVLFYLVAYGIMNLGAFAVLGLLQRLGEDAETYDDLRGLVGRRPGLAVAMAVCVFSLMGLPPLVGFWGKVYLFGAAISAGYIWLAVLGVINSAIAAYYYLKIVGVCFLDQPNEQTVARYMPWRTVSVVGSVVLVILLSLGASVLLRASQAAAISHYTRSIELIGQGEAPAEATALVTTPATGMNP